MVLKRFHLDSADLKNEGHEAPISNPIIGKIRIYLVEEMSNMIFMLATRMNY
jgi:hypothetical protein